MTWHPFSNAHSMVYWCECLNFTTPWMVCHPTGLLPLVNNFEIPKNSHRNWADEKFQIGKTHQGWSKKTFMVFIWKIINKYLSRNPIHFTGNNTIFKCSVQSYNVHYCQIPPDFILIQKFTLHLVVSVTKIIIIIIIIIMIKIYFLQFPSLKMSLNPGKSEGLNFKDLINCIN
jgi:hypothetical protein